MVLCDAVGCLKETAVVGSTWCCCLWPLSSDLEVCEHRSVRYPFVILTSAMHPTMPVAAAKSELRTTRPIQERGTHNAELSLRPNKVRIVLPSVPRSLVMFFFRVFCLLVLLGSISQKGDCVVTSCTSWTIRRGRSPTAALTRSSGLPPAWEEWRA